MTKKLNHGKSNIVFAGLSIAAFLATGILIAAGQGYNSYNDPQATLDRIDAARAYENLYSDFSNSYPYNGPLTALDLADYARANDKLYGFDTGDWGYWANVWLNAI